MKSLLLRMMLVLLALLVLVPAVSTNAEFGLDEPFPSDSSLYGSANRGQDPRGDAHAGNDDRVH